MPPCTESTPFARAQRLLPPAPPAPSHQPLPLRTQGPPVAHSMRRPPHPGSSPLLELVHGEANGGGDLNGLLGLGLRDTGSTVYKREVAGGGGGMSGQRPGGAGASAWHGGMVLGGSSAPCSTSNGVHARTHLRTPARCSPSTAQQRCPSQGQGAHDAPVYMPAPAPVTARHAPFLTFSLSMIVVFPELSRPTTMMFTCREAHGTWRPPRHRATVVSRPATTASLGRRPLAQLLHRSLPCAVRPTFLPVNPSHLRRASKNPIPPRGRPQRHLLLCAEVLAFVHGPRRQVRPTEMVPASPVVEPNVCCQCCCSGNEEVCTPHM